MYKFRVDPIADQTTCPTLEGMIEVKPPRMVGGWSFENI